MDVRSDQLVTLSLERGTNSLDPSLAPGELRTSSYCIFVKLSKRPDRVLLVHGYTGAYDEVSLDIAAYLHAKRTASVPLYGKWTSDFDSPSGHVSPSEGTLAELENRGYLTTLTVSGEKQRIRSIAAAVHSFETQGLNYIVVPSYDCNLRCPYCFQDYMRTEPSFQPKLRQMTRELVDQMLAGILDLEKTTGKSQSDLRQFTLFGGEPLLAKNLDIVGYIVRRARALGPTKFGAVTNGTELEAYAELLHPDAISSLQITLDGPPQTHDRFRIYADGQGSYERISRNISFALERGVAVTVRVNVCKDNIGNLPALAEEAKRRGWADHDKFGIYAAPIQPAPRFPNSGQLLNSYELSQSLQRMQEEDPVLRMVETADDTMKRRALTLFQHPEIDPITDFKASYCGAHAGMYIFDPFGDIYACWEKMGDSQIRIGRVGGEGKLLLEKPSLDKWRSRTIASNPTCESCSYALQCGGGCAVLAEAKNGRYLSNFCDGFGMRFKAAVAEAYETFLTEEESGSSGSSVSSRSALPC